MKIQHFYFHFAELFIHNPHISIITYQYSYLSVPSHFHKKLVYLEIVLQYIYIHKYFTWVLKSLVENPTNHKYHQSFHWKTYDHYIHNKM